MTTMDIYSKPGTKVTFLNVNGTEFNRAKAEKILKIGCIYTIKSIDIQNCISYVTLEEISGKFNSVMFNNIKLA